MNKSMLDNKQAIIEQWDVMLSRGIMPVLEYELKGNDYLLVDLELLEHKGELFLQFSFDNNGLLTYFNGDINGNDGSYFYSYKIDLYYISNDLQTTLEYISDNIMEGYILPNGLFPDND